MNTFLKVNEKIGRYRWTICFLLFFATTVNYLDRQVLSLLKDRLEVQFNWTDSDYANIVDVFLFVYAISMLFAGRFIDWLGTKIGYAWALVIWSIGALSHALAKGTGGFMISRGILGFGESGNFPAANKTNAEWFPKKERALSFGIFNSGANIGAIIAPITVPLIAEKYGWQAAFLIIGGIGFSWLIFWFWLYEIPAVMLKKGRLKQAEYDYIHSGDAQPEVSNHSGEKSDHAAKKENIPWVKLLRYRQTWAFFFGKFLTDGVWWFYLFWLPAYLKAQYSMVGTQVILPLAVLYSISTIGSITGGWFPMHFINKGYEPYAGRMRAMLIIGMIPLVVLSAQYLGGISYWMPVLIIGIGTAAHQAWSANLFTTVSDMFPKKSIASVTGIGGMAGALGGILINKSAGWLFDGYRSAGIAKSWIAAQAENLGGYVEKVRSLNLVNAHNDIVNLDQVELGNLPANMMQQVQAINPAMFDQMKALQAPIVQSNMTIAYTWVFVFCALAYLTAWLIMKSLVPKYKLIEDL